MALDRIPGDANLYIGGLFSVRGKQALTTANITHILSALRLALDEGLFADYQHLVVEVDDVEDENIIEHFPTSNAFIQQGLDAGGGVLIHCAMGKSRSTTLLIAYLLSKHPHYTPKSTLALIRRTRPFAEPNDGFMRQLTLYHDMHCPSSIDPHPLYQRWLYQRDVEASLACGVAPDTIRFGDEIGGSAVVGTPGEEEGPELDRGKEKVEFRCRRCRTSLSTSQYLISHTPFPDKPTNNIATIRQTPISSLPASTATQRSPCAHLFLEPLSWMRPELEQGKLDGRLECPNPKCKTNVGKYAWQGMKCSCGEWVVPGISIARGRVDEMKVKKGSLGKVGKI